MNTHKPPPNSGTRTFLALLPPSGWAFPNSSLCRPSGPPLMPLPWIFCSLFSLFFSGFTPNVYIRKQSIISLLCFPGFALHKKVSYSTKFYSLTPYDCLCLWFIRAHLCIVFHCVTTSPLYPFTCQWTLHLFPVVCHYLQCCCGILCVFSGAHE